MSPADRMTIGDVADHLGVSRWTVYRLLDSASIQDPSGGACIPTPEYVAWLNSQAIAPGPEDGSMQDLPTLHRFEDVAARYDLSLRSLKDNARARRFAYTRIGRGWYFTDPQLLAFLAAREVKAERDVALDGVRQRRDRRRNRQPAAA